MNVLQHVNYNSENSMKNVLVLVRIDNVLIKDGIHCLVPTDGKTLEGAKVNRDGLVTLLRECKGLVMLDVRDCSGFDENNDEISKLASHIKQLCVLSVEWCGVHLVFLDTVL
ncbi:hypothetical protein GBA52_018093 [Prunus armeniaca]|nr:hypothetical protein GBA52_018093 [Prunus armeniaca]